MKITLRNIEFEARKWLDKNLPREAFSYNWRSEELYIYDETDALVFVLLFKIGYDKL